MKKKKWSLNLKPSPTFAEINDFLDMPIKRYSSEECVRPPGFAVTVNLEPDILLIDEVLAVGDESLRKNASPK